MRQQAYSRSQANDTPLPQLPATEYLPTAHSQPPTIFNLHHPEPLRIPFAKAALVPYLHQLHRSFKPERGKQTFNFGFVWPTLLDGNKLLNLAVFAIRIVLIERETEMCSTCIEPAAKKGLILPAQIIEQHPFEIFIAGKKILRIVSF